MTAFRSELDLRRSLHDAGLDALADRIAATARPALQYVRHQRPDDALAPGTSPELTFAGHEDGRIEPGDDRIRHVFSWGGEYYAGTRRMHAPFGGDGTTYLMIPREDLLNRRFDAARALYQCD